jgi:hypothetical protein
MIGEKPVVTGDSRPLRAILALRLPLATFQPAVQAGSRRFEPVTAHRMRATPASSMQMAAMSVTIGAARTSARRRRARSLRQLASRWLSLALLLLGFGVVGIGRVAGGCRSNLQTRVLVSAAMVATLVAMIAKTVIAVRPNRTTSSRVRSHEI